MTINNWLTFSVGDNTLFGCRRNRRWPQRVARKFSIGIPRIIARHKNK